MSGRRSAVLAAVAVFGGATVAVAPLSSAAPTFPRPCPTQPLVWESQGNVFVSVPDPTGKQCRDTFEVSLNTKRPGDDRVGAAAVPTVPVPPPCPVAPLVYQWNGHLYVSVPNPTGKTCRITVELPIGLPPSSVR